jgi:hypothetical protein
MARIGGYWIPAFAGMTIEGSLMPGTRLDMTKEA